MGQDTLIVQFGDGFQAAAEAASAFDDVVPAADVGGLTVVATALASTLVRFAPDMMDPQHWLTGCAPCWQVPMLRPPAAPQL